MQDLWWYLCAVAQARFSTAHWSRAWPHGHPGLAELTGCCCSLPSSGGPAQSSAWPVCLWMHVLLRFLYGYPKRTVNSYINGERHLFPHQHSGLTVSEVQLRAQAVAADNASLTDRDLGHFLEEHVARHASASRDPQRSWRAAGSVSHSPISSLQCLLQEEKLLCSAQQLLRHLCPAISHGGTGMGQFLPCLRPVFSRRTKVKQIIPCYCRE